MWLERFILTVWKGRAQGPRYRNIISCSLECRYASPQTKMNMEQNRPFENVIFPLKSNYTGPQGPFQIKKMGDFLLLATLVYMVGRKLNWRAGEVFACAALKFGNLSNQSLLGGLIIFPWEKVFGQQTFFAQDDAWVSFFWGAVLQGFCFEG